MALIVAGFPGRRHHPRQVHPGAGPTAPSPKLEWTNVPAGTASFVLIMHDPDNALNKTPDDVLHWMVFNIPGTAHGLAGGLPTDAKLSDGTIQAKGIRNVGYMGPGNAAINPYHHYTLELYALDSMLSLGPDATRADVMTAMGATSSAKRCWWAASSGRNRLIDAIIPRKPSSPAR